MRVQSLLVMACWMAPSCKAFVGTAPSYNANPASKTDSSRLWSTTEDDQAKKLLDRAAQLRAEIAAMEGKTTEQVETEAREKKALERQRADEQEAQRLARKQQERPKAKTNGDSYMVQVPVTPDDMIRQAARAVERAFRDGKTRQTVRFNLVNEEQSAVEENEFPGGAKQMYREAGKPLTMALLKEIRAPTERVDEHVEERQLSPTVKTQDVWDFDGSAIHTAEAREGASADVQALVFPNTDVKYINDIEKISDAMGSRLFLLVNPFWRNVDSWSFNLLAPGAKQKAQSTIFDNDGYEETYVTLVFSVRGEKCVALKAYPYDWQLFAFLEDDYYNTESAIRLGSCPEEPTSALVTELLNARPEFKETKTMRQMKKMF